MSIQSKALAQTSSPHEPASKGQDIPRSGGEEVLRPSLIVSVLVKYQSCSVSSFTTCKDLTSQVGLPKSREGGTLKSNIDHWGEMEKHGNGETGKPNFPSSQVLGQDSDLPNST